MKLSAKSFGGPLANLYRHIKSASALGRPPCWIGPWRRIAGNDQGHSHDRDFRIILGKRRLSNQGYFFPHPRPRIRKTAQRVEELRAYVQQETLQLASIALKKNSVRAAEPTGTRLALRARSGPILRTRKPLSFRGKIGSECQKSKTSKMSK